MLAISNQPVPGARHEVTLLIRKRRPTPTPPTAVPQQTSPKFQIEVPTELLGDFGLGAGDCGSKVIHCMRAA